MNRLLTLLFPAAFVGGLAAIAWAGFSALQHHPLALGMTALIAAFYLLAALELRRFRAASSELSLQLSRPLAEGLEPWLQAAPAAVRGLLQQRLAGQRVQLSGLQLAPALAALLVLLGMLGTFIGLVLTLGGTATALSATADLAAMRAALTAPVKGLGLAFGTSVAGVAASAMLGLMVALARRERAGVQQQLESLLAGALRPFSSAFQREQAEHLQAQALPALVQQLQGFASELAAQQQQFQQQFQAGWLAEQSRFHASTQTVFQDLARSVQHSLQTALLDSAKEASTLLQPVAQSTMAGIAREASALHAQVAAQSAAQLQAVGARFEAGAEQLTGHWQQQLSAQLAAQATRSDEAQAAWQQGLTSSQQQLQQVLSSAQATLHQAATQSQQTLQALHQQAEQQQAALQGRSEAALAAATAHSQQQAEQLSSQFAAQLEQLLAHTTQAQATQQQALQTGDAQRLAQWREALGGSAEQLQQQLARSQAEQLQQQQRLADALADTARAVVADAQLQSKALLSEVGSLLRAAAETPRAAAEMAAALREQLSRSLAQDNQLLAERTEQAARLQKLLAGAEQSASAQSAAIDALNQAAGTQLQSTGREFGEQLQQLAAQFASSTEASSTQLRDTAALIAASSAEMGALGEGFSVAVEQFQGSNTMLVARLGQIETALTQAGSRSDEQLAYTVAQARELIDLCLMAQKQALDALRLAAPEAAHGA